MFVLCFMVVEGKGPSENGRGSKDQNCFSTRDLLGEFIFKEWLEFDNDNSITLEKCKGHCFSHDYLYPSNAS